MREPKKGSGYHWDLYGPFIAHVLVSQTIVGLTRIATSYRSLELGFSVEVLGIITGCFALFPIFLAVPLGRWLDRGKDAQALWIGSLLVLLACFGFWWHAFTETTMILYTLLQGVGYLFVMAGQQTFAVRCAEPHLRDSVFGTYMMSIAIGQGAGPIIIGFIAAGSTIAPSAPLFAISLMMAGLALLVSFTLRPAPPVAQKHRERKKVPLKAMLRLHGFVPMILASVMTVTSLDLLAVYMPILGAERNIDVAVIGTLLAIRTGLSVASRVVFTRLIQMFGRMPLMVFCLFLTGVAFAILASPAPVWALGIATGFIGIGLGVAAALALSSIVELAPPEAQGTAVTLRITGNRIGQATIPLAAGLVAGAMGAAGVMAVLGVAVGASGLAVMTSWLRKPAS